MEIFDVITAEFYRVEACLTVDQNPQYKQATSYYKLRSYSKYRYSTDLWLDPAIIQIGYGVSSADTLHIISGTIDVYWLIGWLIDELIVNDWLAAM